MSATHWLHIEIEPDGRFGIYADDDTTPITTCSLLSRADEVILAWLRAGMPDLSTLRQGPSAVRPSAQRSP